MIYQFTTAPGLRGHNLEADLKITPGANGDLETPAEGPQIECLGIWMLRGHRRRRLHREIEAGIEDTLVERTFEILNQWTRDAMQDAADRR